MKRKPRSLFCAQDRGGGYLYLGPKFAGPQPHYLALLDRVVADHPERFVPGKVQHVSVKHDDWCAVFSGGPCNCDPDVELMDGPP